MRHAALSAYPSLVAVIAILVIIGVNFEYDILSQALLVPFLYMLYRAAGIATPLFAGISSLKHDSYSFFGLVELVDVLFEAPETSNGHVQFPQGCRLEEISVSGLSIGRDAPLLNDIDFNVTAGDTIVISGESGKGKTTLLMTLVGQLLGLGGGVTWNGIAIGELDPQCLRTRIGYAGPDPYLFEGTIAENLTFGLATGTPTPDQFEYSMECACAQFIKRIPGGLSYRLGDNGDGISAGQKQRLSLARALLREPDVLILDEATANVDEETEAKIFERVRQEFPEIIIIAVSHRNSMRRFATKHIEL